MSRISRRVVDQNILVQFRLIPCAASGTATWTSSQHRLFDTQTSILVHLSTSRSKRNTPWTTKRTGHRRYAALRRLGIGLSRTLSRKKDHAAEGLHILGTTLAACLVTINDHSSAGRWHTFCQKRLSGMHPCWLYNYAKPNISEPTAGCPPQLRHSQHVIILIFKMPIVPQRDRTDKCS
jgi:hypothetical protein